MRAAVRQATHGCWERMVKKEKVTDSEISVVDVDLLHGEDDTHRVWTAIEGGRNEGRVLA